MTTKALIREFAIQRRVAKTALSPAIRKTAEEQLASLALKLAHQQADAYDDRMRLPLSKSPRFKSYIENLRRELQTLPTSAA